MTKLSEVTKKIQQRLGGKGAYQVTEWLVKTIIDEYEDSKPVYYRPLRNGIFQNDEKRT
jgi:hypothetical protein